MVQPVHPVHPFQLLSAKNVDGLDQMDQLSKKMTVGPEIDSWSTPSTMLRTTLIDEVSVIVSVAVTGSAVDDHWIHVVVLNMEHVLWMFA